MGYSKPVELEMDLNDLKEKIFIAQINQMDSLCNQLLKKNGDFVWVKKKRMNYQKENIKLKIESSFTDEYLELSHALLKGEEKKKFSLVHMFVIHLW